MPTSYCGLEDAYGNWDNKEIKNKQNLQISHQQQQQQQQQTEESKPQEALGVPRNNNQRTQGLNVDFDSGNDIRSFCPNCNNCVKKNDALQQQIIDQTIMNRPHWVPQLPQAYAPFDPYNRYWTQTNGIEGREDFGNTNDSIFNMRKGSSDNIEILLKIIIFIICILFFVQLIDLIFKLKKDTP
jgi:hypothetical protein